MGWVGAAHRSPSKRSVFQRGELLPVKSEEKLLPKRQLPARKMQFFSLRGFLVSCVILEIFNNEYCIFIVK